MNKKFVKDMEASAKISLNFKKRVLKGAEFDAYGYARAMISYLSVVVTQFSTYPEALDYLAKHCVPDLLVRYGDTLDQVMELIEQRDVLPTSFAGRYRLCVLSHVASMFQIDGIPSKLARYATHEYAGPGPFWEQYAIALTCLLEGQPFASEKAQALKLRGEEKYWFVYIKLMDAMTNGQATEPVIEEANQLFAKRNSDKRYQTDNHQIEGSPYRPALLDFRLEAILQAYRNRNA